MDVHRRRARCRWRPGAGANAAAPFPLLALLPLVAVLALSVLAACDSPRPTRATLSVAEALTGDTAGYLRATEPRSFSLPEDHGVHPGYRHEWWYFTGNLSGVPEASPRSNAGADADRLGFQLTFFRSALRPGEPDVESDWATSQAYMAHFAVTDAARGEHHGFERFERGALGLARAESDALDVHVGDWRAWSEPEGRIRLVAAEGDVAIDLVLRPARPMVLQGDGGLSRKGPEPGNASYYYSLTRMAADGTVAVAGERYRVAGLAWLDREWGTSALGEGVVGWDWFALQLDDDRELMYYRLRREDGTTDPFSAGTLADADGRVVRLSPDDVTLDETGEWTSPSGVRYPSGWRLRVPRHGLDLRLEPLVRDQELDLAFRYWEGAVTVTGSESGVGYVELTGYARTSTAGLPKTRSTR